MTCILLVDDEVDLVWAVQHSLYAEGYDVLTAYDGGQALAVARHHHPDLIVLDIIMPQLDGLQVCYQMRHDPTLAAIPIVFLTERSTIEDRVDGLNNGGDDYIVKPFDLRELKARIRALLRRSQVAAIAPTNAETRDSLLRMGPFVLNLNTFQVKVGGQMVQLTPTEFDVLYYLMTHPGEVFSSNQLLRRIWSYPPQTADPSLVRWHVKNLRTKIEPDPDHPAYIRTIPHHGYLLDGCGI